ncbi:MAG TPA: hypothetical protein VMS71_04425, partial [Candidatus Acidoferrum sp.]|nr:hypothetical protein [Candidatus Acidoferrum sp.]
ATEVPFEVIGLPIGGLTYQWSLNSTPIPGATGSSITLSAPDLYHAGLPAWGTLSLKISYRTTMVRGHDISNTLTWTVLADCNGNGVRDDFDIQNGTAKDVNHNGIPDECDFTLCCKGVTGNIDGDTNDIVDISDLSDLIDYLFNNGPISDCPQENDVDKSGAVDIGDVTSLIEFLFFSLPLPACP